MTWQQRKDDRDRVVAALRSDECVVTLLDRVMQKWQIVGGGDLGISFERTLDGSGAFTMTLPPTHPVAAPMEELHEDAPLLIVAQTPTFRWCGFCSYRGPKLVGKLWSTVVTGVEIELLLDELLPLLRDPTKPVGEQPSIAPVVSGRAVTECKQVLRAAVEAQWPGGGPIVVAPEIVEDTSPPVTFTLDGQPAYSGLKDVLAGTGVAVVAWVWMPGDGDEPGDPPLPGLSLALPTVVVDVVDYGSWSGWAGTDTDPVLQYQRVLSGGGFGADWEALAAPEPSVLYPRGQQMQDRRDPWIVWHPDMDGVLEMEFGTYPARGARALWSGLRQGWLREVIGQDASAAAAAGALHTAAQIGSALGAAITADTFLTDISVDTDVDVATTVTVGFTGVGSSTTGFLRGREADYPGGVSFVRLDPEAASTASASTSTSKTRGFNATAMTESVANIPAPATSEATDPVVWQEVVDDTLADRLGPLFGGGRTIITSTNAEDLISALWDRKGKRVLTVKVENGRPYFLGVHFGLGHPQAFALPSGRLWLDRVSRVSYSRERGAAARLGLTVGDGQRADPPSVRFLSGLRRQVQTLTQHARDLSAIKKTSEDEQH